MVVIVYSSGLVTQISKMINAKNLTARSFKSLLERTGLPRSVRLHDLRHTCATVLLSRGVHPKLDQELLGHKNISITLDTYSHVLPNMPNETVSAMETPFPSATMSDTVTLRHYEASLLHRTKEESN